MPIDKEPATPPPMIGKIGPYTVFVTPPPTPKPGSFPAQSPVQSPPQPPVLPPPAQYPKTTVPSNAPPFGFFWNAVAKLQNAHSSLDESVAHWFGLNQSKYQWALDEYHESKGHAVDQVDAKAKNKSNKMESV
ncbi:hypothetical protein LguiA_007405 [Lonicera macranthoides]